MNNSNLHNILHCFRYGRLMVQFCLPSGVPLFNTLIHAMPFIHTVMQFPLSPASDIFGLQTLGHYSCQGRRQHWGWGVLRSPGHASGTVCQLPFEPQRSRLWRSPDISRATCL